MLILEDDFCLKKTTQQRYLKLEKIELWPSKPSKSQGSRENPVI